MFEMIVKEIACRAIDHLPDQTRLHELDYRDMLTPDQLQDLLHEDLYPWEITEHWDASYSLDYYTQEAVQEAYRAGDLPCKEIPYLFSEAEFYIREEVYARDVSEGTIAFDMASNSHETLFRLVVDSGYYEKPGQIVEVLEQFTGPGHRPALQLHAATLLDMPCEGDLEFLFAANPGTVADEVLLNGAKTVTFKSPAVVVHDTMSGAGYDHKFEGLEFTVPLDADHLHVDEAGPGYSWTEICGPVVSWYAPEVLTFT